MTGLRVSVVLPCFEEAAGLPEVVAAIERSLAAAGAAFEIVIVASAAGTDGTVAVARDLGANDPAVRVVVQARDDGGYGRALALGITASREPWVLLMDADGQFDPGDAGRLLGLAPAADVVAGFRAPRRDPLGRRVAGAIYSRALAVVTGVPVRDFDCGFKLLRRDLVQGLVIKSRTGVANAEILAGAARAGARIVEAPVSHAPRGAGRARFQVAFGLPSPREASRMLREAAELGVRLLRARRLYSPPRTAYPERRGGAREVNVQEPTRDRAHHEQHRALSIQGKSFCNSACVFCVEKFTSEPSVSPKSDEVRALILQGRGKYNMLHFMNGEPSLHPKIFEHVELAKANGYRYFGMSSHFRAFADPHLALRFLEAGFEFFDISLHAATPEAQEVVNPIGDEGSSLKEALHGLRNMFEIARRYRRRVAITHKIVISRLNHRDLLPIFGATYRLGVRNYILQPVKAQGLDPALTAQLAVNEDEFMPMVNDLLRATEGSGAEIKLYGMSQLGAYPSGDVVQETNLIKHVHRKLTKLPTLDLHRGDRLIPEVIAPSSAPSHRVTVRLPTTQESATFECREDQFILNAALSGGVVLPFGCRMGSCGSCTGRVVEGEVDLAPQVILSAEQIAAGFTVLCKTRPRSDVMIVTHQELELGL